MRNGIEASYPATSVQAGMIFHALTGASAGHYCEQAIIAMPEAVDIDLFRAAWRRVVARHDVLRTSFDVTGSDRPMQLVHRQAEIPISAHDWRGLPRSEQLHRRNRLLVADREAGFDLASPPLVRASLCRVGEQESWVLPSFHHAVLDSYGSVIMLGEGFRLYRAMRDGEELPLPEPQPFRRFVQWLGGQDAERAHEFWRARLAGASVPMPLPPGSPGARPGPPGVRRRRVSATVKGELRELTDRAGATLGVTLQAAWALTLAGETGVDDVVFGVSRAGRRSPPFPTDYMMGVTITTIPTRARVQPRRRLVQWLGELHRESVAVREFEHTPLLDIQRAAGAARGRALFETVFSFEHGDQRAILCAIDETWGERDFELLDRPSCPLTVKVSEDGGALVVEALFDGARVTASTAVRLLARYCATLRSFVARPEARLEALDSSTRALDGSAQVPSLSEPAPREPASGVADAFEAQARRTPGAVAVEQQSRSMTYAQLDAAANRLAWRLRSLGVERETLVAVGLPRSPELVVALLGVLKAGGAYLPLDVEHPPHRLAAMLADGGCPVLVGTSQLAASLPSLAAHLEPLEPGAAVAPGEREDPPPRDSRPDDLAYVMYTSGSTGAPKGVEVTHRGVVRLVRGADYVRLGPGEVHLQLASIGFDASTFEIWGALLNGARLAIAPAQTPSLSELGRLVARHGVTTLWLTAGLFHEMVDFQLEGLRGVRQLLAGGDVLSPSHVRAALSGLAGATVINGYGPTESTTFACCHPMSAPDQVGASVPIGRPIAHTYARVLDDHLRPLAPGIAGELCIGGEGLARGYRNDPDLTAERFVEDPLSGEPGARLYRTGDRVRLRSDGRLDFLGRLDIQVKVRGVRVEPAEVEATLVAHPDIAQAAVVARPDSRGDRRLVAYLVAHPEARDSDIDPRGFLARRLPAAMVPESCVTLAALPLSASGKIDRCALPLTHGNGATAHSRLAPRTPTEHELAAIWSELLDIPRVGVRDDFFEAGGHSLLTMRLFAEIETRIGVKLPVSAIFTASTVEALAALLDGDRARDSWRSLVAVSTSGRGRPLFCVHGAGGEVALFRELGRRIGADRPFYGLQARGLDGESELLRSVEEMAAHYLTEVRCVQPCGPYLLAGMCMGGLVALEMAQQLRSCGEQVAFLGVIDSPAPRRTDPDRAPGAFPGRRNASVNGRAPRPVRQAARDARRRARRHARREQPVSPRDLVRGFWWRPLKALRRWRRDMDKWRDRRARAWRRRRKRARRAVKQQWQWLTRALFGRRAEDGSLLQRARDLVRQVQPDEIERRRRRVEVANREAQRAYVAAPYAGAISVLHCQESVSRPHRRRYTAWETAAGGRIDHVVVPGTHQTMLRPPAVQELADLLLARIEEAERTAAPSGDAEPVAALD